MAKLIKIKVMEHDLLDELYLQILPDSPSATTLNSSWLLL